MLSNQRDSVEEGDSSIVTAAGAVEAVIEDPLLPILKLDSCETQPSGNLGNPGFDHDAASPGPEIFVKDFIPHSQVGMSLDSPLARWSAFFLREPGNRAYFLRKSFQGADSLKTLERERFYLRQVETLFGRNPNHSYYSTPAQKSPTPQDVGRT